MRTALAVMAFVILASGCASAAERPSPASGGSGELAGYGLELRLPAGWQGRVERGLVVAATLVPPADLSTRATDMRADDVVLSTQENGGSDDPFVPVDGPPSLARSDLLRPDAFGRARVPDERAVAKKAVALSGRKFVLSAVFGAREPTDSAFVEVNQVLGSLSVKGGDFYAGTIEPPSFDPAADWFSGSGGATAREAWGEQAESWASTVELGDHPEARWPRVLRQLAPDDVFVLAWLSRIGPTGRFTKRALPYQLAEADIRPSWGGQPSRNVPEYLLLSSTEGGIDVELRVYFGRPDPTPAQLAAAQAELDGLRLPDWGPWELE